MAFIKQRVNQLMDLGGRSKEETSDFLQRVLILLIDLFRHLMGDEFVAGFLQAAIDDIESGEPTITNMVEKRMH
ncbi:MAG: hypothetical protein Q8Q50_02780 [Methylobacter sp.]|nr:hypothetical protein [Methylobacter sp.]